MYNPNYLSQLEEFRKDLNKKEDIPIEPCKSLLCHEDTNEEYVPK